jgi:acyl-CoA dehydrogenase
MIGDSVPFASAAASCPVCLRLSRLLLTLQTMSTGHHARALSLAHHAHEGQIARLTSRIAADESLLASATTEITTGGDVRSSTCA